MCFWEVVLILRLTAYWKYQSNGWCHDHCVGDYAFAIVQDFNCWCSNYAPGVTSSSDNCDTECPGYTEFCGGNGFYGYIALNKTSSGTIGASSLTASSTSVSHPSRQDLQVNMLHLQSLSLPIALRLLWICCTMSAILTFLQNQVTVTASSAPVTIFSTVAPTPSQGFSTSLFV
jgi:hypothetical protein